MLESAEESPPTITHVIIKAPEERCASIHLPRSSDRSDSPRLSVRASYGYHTVRSGRLLPLSCAAQIQPSDTAAFDGFDERKYAQWVARKKAMGEPVTEMDPVTYFDLQKSWCLIQKLDVPRTGRYVLIKLLRSRVPTADKIDVQVPMPLQATPLTMRAVRWLQGIHRLSELLLRRALLTEILLCIHSLRLMGFLTLLVALIVISAEGTLRACYPRSRSNTVYTTRTIPCKSPHARWCPSPLP